MITKFHYIKYAFLLSAFLWIFTASDNHDDKVGEGESYTIRAQDKDALRRPFLSIINSNNEKGYIIRLVTNLGPLSIAVPPGSKFVLVGSLGQSNKLFVKGFGLHGAEYGFTFSIENAVNHKNAWSISGSPQNVTIQGNDIKLISNSIIWVNLKSIEVSKGDSNIP
jgi:hypothetical protein